MQRKALVGALTFVVALVAAASLLSADRDQRAKPSKPTTVTTVLRIEGMSCSSCVARVKKALRAVKGVTEVQVSLEKRQGEVRHEPTAVSPDSMARLVSRLGYRARVVERGRP